MKDAAAYKDLLKEVASLRDKLKRREEYIAYLERCLYGSKRDRKVKPSPDGATLFDGFFEEAVRERDAAIAQTAEKVKAEAEARRKRSRSASSRPAKVRYCGLEERCRTEWPAGINTDDYIVIDSDVTRILHREPARLWVEVIKRPILRHKDDRNVSSPRILQAPPPRPVIKGNHVAADLLADLVVNKFVHHLPEYRQARMYADLGSTLPTSTINDWVHAVAAKLYPLYESHCENIRSRSYLQVDEVPWRIADRPDKCRTGYAWQFHDATPDTHGLYFYYYKGSRGGALPRSQLKDFKGAIQTDGYKVYDYFELQPGVTLLGCMAHVRRKFIEAQSSYPELAAKALDYISLLYEVEGNLRARNAKPDKVALERRKTSLPFMDAMEEWMKSVSTRCTPADPLGKALDYAYKLWPRLRRYADDGTYHIDNNPVERCQRPSVMGRKNYLFSKNDRGAEDNAVFYSLLESCRLLGINPLKWLTDVLNTLHDDSTEEEIRKLLPYNYKKESQD